MSLIKVFCLALLFVLFLFSCERFDVSKQVIVEENVVYGENLTQAGLATKLLLDIYRPNTKREDLPLLVLIHGGGFKTGSKEGLSKLASQIAQNDIIVAAINYRLIDVEESLQAGLRGIIDAVFDTKSAIRFLMSYNKRYKFDTDRIYVGGHSAGAITALHTAYLDQSYEVVWMGGIELLDYVELNGGLRGNSGNQLTLSPSIKGVINISGGITNIYFIQSGGPSIFSIHGKADKTVPIGGSRLTEFNIPLQGSSLIHNEAERVDINSTLKVLKGGHSAFSTCGSCNSELVYFINSN
ncbi:MAG: alpha/beta hydrolase [Bacteroidota bacterium]